MVFPSASQSGVPASDQADPISMKSTQQVSGSNPMSSTDAVSLIRAARKSFLSWDCKPVT